MSEDHCSHILVVNDIQEMLDLFEELFEEEGFRVTTSLTVLDIDEIVALAPDLIVQDNFGTCQPERPCPLPGESRSGPAAIGSEQGLGHLQLRTRSVTVGRE